MSSTTNEIIQEHIRRSIEVKSAILSNDTLVATIAQMAGAAVKAYRKGKKLLVAGNGGSAADAQHIAGEMVCRFRFDRPGLPAIALSTDTSTMTAISNDYGYDRIFSRQVEALGVAGDVFVGISTSGNSPNIVEALKVARKKGLVCIGLTGQHGKRMARLCDHCFLVPSVETPRIQESHILVAHIFCGLVEDSLFA